SSLPGYNRGARRDTLGRWTNPVFLSLTLALLAAPPEPAADSALFEAKIRPVLVSKCYGCHSAKVALPKGELLLDTKDGLLKGGARGSAIVRGKPEQSLLLSAIRYADK